MFQIPSTELGIDFGSSNTRIFRKEKGIVLNEPSVAAMQNGEMIAAGNRAAAMIGRTPAPLRAVHPVKSGAIADMACAGQLLAHFIKQAAGRSHRLLRPVKLSVCVPTSASELEKHALMEVARSAAGVDIQLRDSSVAAAYGMGLDAAAPRGRLIADIGSGVCQASVISLNGVVAHRNSPGGDMMDTAITEAVRREYNIIIGESSAEYLKQAIGSLRPQSRDLTASIRGRSTTEGLPTRVDVHSSVITDAILPVARQIASAILRVYEDAPPELAADISEDGIYLTGGLSLLHGMAELITETTGIAAHTCDRPFTSSAEGALFADAMAASPALGTA